MDVALPEPGVYVVAVSGGVDSMVLLDVLRRQPGLQLVVAHFDHGMRADSAEDRRLVQAVAAELPFVYEEGGLGPRASEAAARAARYDFLRRVRAAHEAQAILTAHHQDDVLETAVINLLRGTGRKGLTALRSRPGLERPLLRVPKRDLINYATAHGLRWREDSTNRDETYLRNYVRHRLLARFSAADRAELVKIFTNLEVTNKELDELLAVMLRRQVRGGAGLDRRWFAQLPHAAAREVLAAWLRASGIRGFDRKTLERLVVAAKTGAPGKRFPVRAGVDLQTSADHLALVGVER